MAAVEIADVSVRFEDRYLAPSCESTGPVKSRIFHPADYSLWKVDGELGADAELRWSSPAHGDEVVFVLEGELNVDGRRCGPETAVIVEAGSVTRLRAVSDATVLHFGSTVADPPAGGAPGASDLTTGSVHIVRPADTRTITDSGNGQYYADSTCATCQVTFFKVSGPEGRVEASHLHTQDEIIHLLTGELRFGPNLVRPGTAVAVPGNLRYGFRASQAFSFLNYRAGVSSYIGAPGSTPVLETVESLRAVYAS